MDAIDTNQNATLARKRIHSQSRQKQNNYEQSTFPVAFPVRNLAQ